MKKLFLLIGCIGLILNLYSQDIATARNQGEGATVTISGIVTNGDELGSPIRYIEDATAALAIYDPEVMGSVNDVNNPGNVKTNKGTGVSLTSSKIEWQ